MLRFFNKNNPTILILIPIIAILFSIKVFYAGFIYELPQNTTVLSNFIFKFIEGDNSLVYATIISTLLLILLTFMFINLGNKFLCLDKRNYFHGFIFLFVTGAYMQPYEFLPVLISEVFFILAIHTLFSTAKRQNSVFQFFNAGFFIAVGSFFWLNLILFAIILFATLIILRRIIIREWITAMIGLVTPYFLFFAVEFLVLSKLDSLFIVSELLFTNNTSYLFNNELYLFIATMSFAVLIGGFSIIGKFASMSINEREYYKIYNWIFIISIVIFIFAATQNRGAILFVLLSFTLPITFFFNLKRRRILLEIIFDTLLLYIIFMQTGIKIPFI